MLESVLDVIVNDENISKNDVNNSEEALISVEEVTEVGNDEMLKVVCGVCDKIFLNHKDLQNHSWNVTPCCYCTI